MKRYRVLMTSAGYRIYDYHIFDIIKQKGKFFLTKNKDIADVLCFKLNKEAV
jgi:hypothetical protein